MSESKHTPVPWSVRDNENGTLVINATEPDGSPCQPARINGNADDEVYGPVTRANAEFIVRACNAHDDLLEACKAIVHAANMGDSAMGGVAATLAGFAIAKAEQ